MKDIYHKIGFILHLSIVIMIVYKLKTNPNYFDYKMVVILIGYGYAVLFDSQALLRCSARECKILGIMAVLLLSYIVFSQKFIGTHLFF